MDRIAQLRLRLAALNKDMVDIQDAADKDNGRELTADEAKVITSKMAEFNNIRADVERREAVFDGRAWLNAEMGRITGVRGARGLRSGTATGGVGVLGDRSELDPMWGFRNAAEFAQSVRLATIQGGRMDDRLAKIRSFGANVQAPGSVATLTSGQNEMVGADGGWLAPPQMRADIIELTFDGTDLINMVNIEPTSSNAVEMEADETTPWGSSGVKAKWRGEGQQMAVTGKAATEPRMLRLNELYAFVTASNEVLSDAPRLNSRLTTRAAQAIRWEASEALMWGSGVGKPLGFMSSAVLVTQAKETGQAIGTIVRQNLLKMFSRLLRMGVVRPMWLCNTDTLPALGELTLGNNGLFFLPQTGFSQGPSASLLGVGIEYSEHCKTLGTAGDIVLVDLGGYYAIRKADDVQFDTSIHLYFDQALTAFRWTFRMGGQPFLASPVTPAQGANTKSPFVALADRTS